MMQSLYCWSIRVRWQYGNKYYKLKPQAVMIVVRMQSIIHMSQRIIAFLNASQIAVILQNKTLSSIMVVARAGLAYLWRIRRGAIPLALNTMNGCMSVPSWMVKAQLLRTAYPLSSVMQLPIYCQIMQIDAFSLTPLHFIPSNAYWVIYLIPYIIIREKFYYSSTM